MNNFTPSMATPIPKAIQWRRFWIALAASLAVLSALLVTVISGGMALAVNLSGLGPFSLQFQSLKATQFQLVPNMVGGHPVSDVSLSGSLVGLNLSKTIPIPGTSKTISVDILAGTPSNPVKVSGLVLDAKNINSSSSSFSKLTIGNSTSGGGINLSAPAMNLSGVSIVGQYLDVGNISLPNLQVLAK